MRNKKTPRTIMGGMKFSAPYDGLAELIIKGYESQNRPDSFTTKTTFSPSKIGGYEGVCPRYWYLAFNGAEFESKMDATSIALVGSGTDAHERIQNALESAGVMKERELEIKMTDPPVRGFADALITWEGADVIAEIKTTGADHFQFRKLNKTPMITHLLQVLIYMKATEISRGLLIYQSRDTLELVMIPVEWDDYNTRLYEYAEGWMREVYAAYKNQTLPAPAFRKDNKICQACPVQKTCFDLPFGELKIAKMDLKTVEK